MTTKKKAAVKDRGKSQPVASKTKEVCTTKFLNLGNSVVLKDGRQVVIRDIPLSAWLDNLAKVLPILTQFFDKPGDISNDELVIALAGNATLKNALYSLISHSSGLTEDEVVKLGVTDALRILVVVKQVIDIEEIKQLFTHLVSGANIPTTMGTRQTPEAKTS